jgi:hypothetical protein
MTRAVVWFVLGLAFVVATTFALSMLTGGDSFRANIGFLLMGGLLAVAVPLLAEQMRRPQQARDLARGGCMWNWPIESHGAASIVKRRGAPS